MLQLLRQTSGAPAQPHWRKALPLPDLWKGLHADGSLKGAHEDSYGREAVQLPRVREMLQPFWQNQKASADPQSGRIVLLRAMMLKFVANPVCELMRGTSLQKLILLPWAQVFHFQRTRDFKSFLSNPILVFAPSVDFLLVHLVSHLLNFVFLSKY